MKKRIFGFLFITIYYCLTNRPVYSASFNCDNTNKPIEIAICNDNLLSHADEQLDISYKLLLTKCDQQVDSKELKTSQRTWLAENYRLFKQDTKTTKLLIEQYARRNEVLNQLINQCAQHNKTITPVIIKTLHELPFFETTPANIGKRINETILGTAAPVQFSEGLSGVAKQTSIEEGTNAINTDYSITFYDGRLLAITISSEGCGAYCSVDPSRFIFDLRNGQKVRTEDFFTHKGREAIAQRLKQNRIKRAQAIVSELEQAKQTASDELETYQRCIQEWSGWDADLWELELTKEGKLRFLAGSCSAHVNRNEDYLDNINEDISLAEISPHLSPYGKSLLLAEGEVRAPVPESLGCKIDNNPAWQESEQSKQIVQAVGSGTSQWESSRFLLKKNGQLWGWGSNYEGVLGIEERGSNHTDVPVLIGNDFAQIAIGQNFAAAIRQDGSLWTWGSDYNGKLGNGVDAGRDHKPSKIGDNFQSVVTNGFGYSAVALKKDHTLWRWGGGRNDDKGRYVCCMDTPIQIADNVAEVDYGSREIIILKKDGTLIAHNRYPKGDDKVIGQGFANIAGKNVQAAFKADHSIWFWGESLSLITEADTSTESSELAAMNMGPNFKTVTNGSNYLAALKTDGSLWVSTGLRLEPIGCGYKEVVALGSGYLLALRQDNTLMAWGNWQSQPSWYLAKNVFLDPPVEMDKGFAKLFPINYGAGVIAIKQDGSVWEWRNSTNSEKPKTKPTEFLQKVLFPN